jgi:hypothetical protein
VWRDPRAERDPALVELGRLGGGDDRFAAEALPPIAEHESVLLRAAFVVACFFRASFTSNRSAKSLPAAIRTPMSTGSAS